MNEAFWRMMDDLVREYEIVIDRPKGSRHPRYPEVVYRLDYGYLKGTSSMDGGGIDLWLGSKQECRTEAIICTVDKIKGDSEIKLLIGCTADEKGAVMRWHNDSDMMKAMLIER